MANDSDFSPRFVKPPTARASQHVTSPSPEQAASPNETVIPVNLSDTVWSRPADLVLDYSPVLVLVAIALFIVILMLRSRSAFAKQRFSTVVSRPITPVFRVSGSDCVWKKAPGRIHGDATRYICQTCNVDAYSRDHASPKVCHRHARGSRL